LGVPVQVPRWGRARSRLQGRSGLPVSLQDFTALSLNALNATNPGGGALSGLHITVAETLARILFGAPPFLGPLDTSGRSSFVLLPGALPPSLIGRPVYGITHVFDPQTLSILGLSNIDAAILR
jgi:hypothetical protein